MNSKAFFLFGCIPTRLLLAFLTARASPDVLTLIGLGAALVAAGFLTLFLTGWRTTGIETGGKPIWWNALRPLHAALYAGVAISIWTGRQSLAWKLLVLDACVGLLAFAVHYVNP